MNAHGGADVHVPLPGVGATTSAENGERFYGATAVPVEEGNPPPAYTDKPPPTYQEATDVNAPPPTYESIYGEFRQVHSPSGFAHFMRRLIGIIVGTVVAAVLVAIISLIPIAMIVIGSINFKNCPAERYIPIYLVVGGVFGLIKSITNFYYRVKAQREGEARNPEENVNPNPFDGILNCFLLVWFIAGSVWVYRTYLPDFTDRTSEDYCDKLTYYFTFCLITITYVMMALFLWLMCCCGCLALCCGRADDS